MLARSMPPPVVLLAALALAAEGPIKLGSPGLSYVSIDDKTGDFFVDFFAQKLIAEGFRVTTKSEISALLGFERQKSLMGCGETATNCLAELAGALGVDGLIVGSLAKTPRGFVMNLKVVSALDARQLAAA